MSQARGLSEAEIIRQAIERELSGTSGMPIRGDLSAMEDFTLLAVSKRTPSTNSQPYRWNREEIYEERASRWFRDRGKNPADEVNQE